MQAGDQIEKHFSANANISKKDIIVGNFLGGLSWGIGSVLGATVVITAVGATLSALGIFAGIGAIFSQITELTNTAGGLNQPLQQLPQIPQFQR